MALNSEQIRLLLELLQKTRDVELTCPECLAELDRYAERTLAGEPVEGSLERVREHLDLCSACDGEFKLVLETLKAMEDS